jgi:hypothetical protein
MNNALHQVALLPLCRTFRDAWQLKHEPREEDYTSSSSSTASRHQQRRLHSIPDFLSSGPMTDVAYKVALKEAGSDKMAYAFVRYLTHCVQVHHVACTMLYIVWTPEAHADAAAVMNSPCSCGSPRCLLKSDATCDVQ